MFTLLLFREVKRSRQIIEAGNIPFIFSTNNVNDYLSTFSVIKCSAG